MKAPIQSFTDSLIVTEAVTLTVTLGQTVTVTDSVSALPVPGARAVAVPVGRVPCECQGFVYIIINVESRNAQHFFRQRIY